MGIPTKIFLVALSLLIPLSLAPPPASAQIAIGVSVRVAPPVLPVYDQPLCPGDGYIWTPGYWAWDGDDYYWVSGTWVLAPQPGFLWTPGFWAWGDSGFVFTAGYWGPVVGFYGGINYGFGYFGHGYVGGRWQDGHFFYNRAVSNINVNVIHNTYETRVNNVTVNRVSYNGGNGGVVARPTSQEEAAAHEQHMAPVAAQTEHEVAARSNPQLRASANHGMPPVAATERPGDFKGGRPAAARESGPGVNPGERPAAERPEGNAARPSTAIHPRDLPPAERMTAPNTGNTRTDKKYQQQQDKLSAQQDKERQKLQKQQDKEDQRLQKQNAADTKRQQTEQRHQQQTQQMAQKHTQQRQTLQQHQQPPAHAAEPHAAAPAPAEKPH